MKRIGMFVFIILVVVSVCGCSSPEDKELRISAQYQLGEFKIYNDGNFDWHNALIIINSTYKFTISELKAGNGKTIEAFRFLSSSGKSYDPYSYAPKTLTIRLDGWEDLKLTFS